MDGSARAARDGTNVLGRFWAMVILAAMLALLAAACGSDDEAPADEGADDDDGTEAADGWPTEPLSIVVPTDPGSGTDRLARGLQSSLSDELGVPVVIDNRPGGGFSVGMGHVLEAEPDGYTVLMWAEPFFTAGRLNIPAELEEWAFVGGLNEDGEAVMAPSDSFESFDEMIDAMEANERVTMGVVAFAPATAGIQATAAALGVDTPQIVDYEGGGELRVDLLGGHVNATAANHDGWRELHETDEARFLAFFTEERYDTFPDVPTVREVVEARGGNPDDVPVLYTIRLMAVSAEFAAQHPERHERLVSALEAVTQDEEFLEWVAENENFEIQFIPPDTLMERSQEYERLTEEYPEAFGQ